MVFQWLRVLFVPSPFGYAQGDADIPVMPGAVETRVHIPIYGVAG